MITHLFFDAGGTIVYPNMEIVATVLRRRGRSVAAEELRRAEPRARLRVDDAALIRETTDQSRWMLYFETIFARCGLSDRALVGSILEELQQIHRVDNLWEVVPPEVPAVLEELRRKYRLAVISNANGTVREKLRRVGLFPFFELILDSHEEGVEKPDPRLFRSAMDRLGARPDRSVYVGDIYHIDVTGARAAGMHAVLLDPDDLHRDKPVPRISTLSALGPSVDALRASV